MALKWNGGDPQHDKLKYGPALLVRGIQSEFFLHKENKQDNPLYSRLWLCIYMFHNH